jgi:hypothetical protein
MPMKPINPDAKFLTRRRELAAVRENCLSRPPEEALEQILSHPQPAALVHAFPEEDLHLLIKEIGPDDALPLIALASHKQLEYLLDQEIWHRDRIDLTATTQWLERLLRAEPSPQRMINWLAEEKTDLVELFLFRSIEVRMCEHDQDPSVFGPDFFSYDNVFFIRILPPPKRSDQEEEADLSLFRDTVKRLLDRLAEGDYVRFQAILLEAAHVLPAETEEEQYRLRTARLAEKGFLPFEEAVGLYQAWREDHFLHRALRQKALAPDHPDLYALVPMTVLPAGNLFTNALATMESPDQRQALQEEFAALCNRIIVADRQTIDSRTDLTTVVTKASGYLHLGLQKLQPKGVTSTAPDIPAAARSLCRYHLEGLFRLGYREAVALKQTAEAWVHRSWFATRGLPLTFWGETWLGVIGGLLIKRPLFFDHYKSGTLYRDFADREEIAWSHGQLDQMQHVDRLLERLNPDLPAGSTQGFMTYKSLLLTLWARHRLALPEKFRPIALQAFQPFFKTLFQQGKRRQGNKAGRRIEDALRTDLLTWLADRTHQTAEDLTKTVGSTLEALFAELEEHYGRVGVDRLDPRYIPHFLLEPPHPPHPK